MSKIKRQRDDPFQTAQARALAVAAGYDPDEKIERVGGKPMPRWCTFIEQARSAENARRLADAVAKNPPQIAPQAEQYKDSPLTIFGNHEQSTIDQMRACMSVGNCVAGVICADGHLGYAQPVGGVVAYDGQISISGVGFDIGCVDAKTEFLSPDGWVFIKDWKEEHVCVFDPKTGQGWFESPLNYVKKESKGFFELKSKYGIDQYLSADHKMLLYIPGPNREFSEYTTMDAEEFVKKHNSLVQGHDYRINTSFCLQKESTLSLTNDEIRLMVAVSADSHFEKRNGIETNIAILSFKKDRKIQRLHEILKRIGIKYCVSNERDKRGYITFRVVPPIPSKDLWKLKNSGSEQLKIIAEESFFWDGNHDDSVYFSRDKRNADFMSYVYASVGYRSVMRKDVHDRDGGVDYRVYAHENIKTGMKADNHIDFVPSEDGMEYCFTVSTGFFVIRRNGIVATTGNCGNMAVRLDVKYDDIILKTPQIMDDIWKTISFGVGRTNDERVEHALFDDADAWRESDMEEYRRKAITQLGTVGGGNHYVDLMRDEDGYVWIGVHFGSRGLGHTSATRYLKAAGGTDGMNVPPAVIDENSEIGIRYIAAMQLAGRYAQTGREWVIERVRQIIGGNIIETVHNHHNYAWKETHNGRDLWVVRKGATPAFPGQKGFVGGSMGDDAVIIEGVDSPEAKAAMYSTVHGAGRLFGRKQAKRTFTQQQMQDWCKERGVLVKGSSVDESPMCYRRLESVLEAHSGSIKILRRLRPFGVAMAGDIEDPWKD